MGKVRAEKGHKDRRGKAEIGGWAKAAVKGMENGAWGAVSVRDLGKQGAGNPTERVKVTKALVGRVAKLAIRRGNAERRQSVKWRARSLVRTK